MKKETKGRFTEIIRMIPVPTVLVAILLLAIYYAGIGIFDSPVELALSVVFLGIVPALSYPICHAEPQLMKGGRNTQRELEIILSLVGSASIWIVGLIMGYNDKLMLILTIYFFAAILLALANELLHVGTSSYACCITAPIIMSCIFLGAASSIIGLILYAAIILVSVHTERHSKEEYILGLAVCVIACAPAKLFCLMI